MMRKRPKYDGDAYQFFFVQSHNAAVTFEDEYFYENTWANTEQYLLALKDLVENRGAQFMLVYIPLEAQLDLEEYGENSRMYFHSQANDHMNWQLKKLSKKHRISFLDLLPAFEENKGQGLYFLFDGHLNEKGHALVAKVMLNHLLRNDNVFNQRLSGN